jgi:hypothetical protein
MKSYVPHTLFACLVVFLVAPYIPTWLLQATVGTYVGSFLLLALGVYILRQNTTLGLAAFLSIAALFLENRMRVITMIRRGSLKTQMGSGGREEGSYPSELAASPDLVTDEVHPPHGEEETRYDAKDDSIETNEVSGIGLDGKAPLSTVGPVTSAVSDFLQKQGLASIDS